MLFDLRGRRRRGIQAIYLMLAILMGGGLVLFGIGGDVQGGLVDAFQQNGGDATKQIEKRVERAEQNTRTNPRDARAFAVLAESRYQLAGVSEGFDETAADPAQAFTGKAREQLLLAERAWDRHVSLAGDEPNVNLANTMQIAFAALNKPEKAVAAQEVVVDARGDQAGFGDYAKLAQLAYSAGQQRKGDLAAARAKELAKDQPKETREALAAQLTQAKATSVTGQDPGAPPTATGAPPATPPTSTGAAE
jgi:hypothetical protein